MQRKVNYTVVGLFVIVLSIAMFSGIAWLIGRGERTEYNVYAVYMAEDVTGLTIQSPVRYNGVEVGFVKSISLDHSNLKNVRILLNIAEGTPINTSTVATVMPQGITGMLYINLKSEEPSAPLLVRKEGDKYPVIKPKPSLFVQAGKVMPEIIKGIEKLTESIDQLLSKENRDRIDKTLVNLENITTNMASRGKDFDKIITNLDRTLVNMNKITKNFPELTDQIKTTMVSVKEASDQFALTSNNAKSLITESRRVADNLSTQVMPDFQLLMNSFNEASSEIQEFVKQLNRNPSIVIRGRAIGSPGPGE